MKGFSPQYRYDDRPRASTHRTQWIGGRVGCRAGGKEKTFANSEASFKK